MGEPEVLRLAADILQRKVTTVVGGAIGRTATKNIMKAILTSGIIIQTIESLQKLADAFDGDADQSAETEEE